MKHASTGKSPHQMLMYRPMRLPWKYTAMPRPAIPDNQSGEKVEQYMLQLGSSLNKLHQSARESMLKQQVRNMKEYNKRKEVHVHGHIDELAAGDLVWVKNANPRKNKLQQQFSGPFYIHKMVGTPPTAAVLSLDGENFVTRSLEHLCRYHKAREQKEDQAETSAAAEQRQYDNPGAYPEKPFTWSQAIDPIVRQELEERK